MTAACLVITLRTMIPSAFYAILNTILHAFSRKTRCESLKVAPKKPSDQKPQDKKYP